MCTLDGPIIHCGELRIESGAAAPSLRVRCWTNDGLRCAEGGTCQPLADLAAECSIGSDCAYCVTEGYCDPTAHVCVAKHGLGAECRPSALPRCAPGLFCADAGVCSVRKPDGSDRLERT
jgi:hypothetical protein